MRVGGVIVENIQRTQLGVAIHAVSGVVVIGHAVVRYLVSVTVNIAADNSIGSGELHGISGYHSVVRGCRRNLNIVDDSCA